jgi:hypothetical protein
MLHLEVISNIIDSHFLMFPQFAAISFPLFGFVGRRIRGAKVHVLVADNNDVVSERNLDAVATTRAKPSESACDAISLHFFLVKRLQVSVFVSRLPWVLAILKV